MLLHAARPHGFLPACLPACPAVCCSWKGSPRLAALPSPFACSPLLCGCPAALQVRRRAQTFLDLLANPSAWDLRLRMGTMAKVGGWVGGHLTAWRLVRLDGWWMAAVEEGERVQAACETCQPAC
jgi:hypothetical protein